MYWGFFNCCIAFLIVVTQTLANHQKERRVYANSWFEGIIHMMQKAWGQNYDVAGHIGFVANKQSVKTWLYSSSLFFFFWSILEPSIWY